MISSIGSPTAIAAFLVFVVAMTFVDLFVIARHRDLSLKEAIGWSIIWVSLAALFFVGIWLHDGESPALEFATGYIIELSLSVDNLFVFILIFTYFGVPLKYQRKVLVYGILGALVMRAVFIVAGATLLERFEWLIYVFGGILIVSGFKIFSEEGPSFDPESSRVYKLFRKLLPATKEFVGDKFIVRRDGRLLVTPLFFVLLIVETTDLIFAVDSIPAIFAITRDPFIVFTSNIFAILGLRSFYFLLVGSLKELRYLHYGLGVVLIFVGAKMLGSHFYKIPTPISLAVVVLAIGASVAASLVVKRKSEKDKKRGH